MLWFLFRRDSIYLTKNSNLLFATFSYFSLRVVTFAPATSAATDDSNTFHFMTVTFKIARLPQGGLVNLLFAQQYQKHSISNWFSSLNSNGEVTKTAALPLSKIDYQLQMQTTFSEHLNVLIELLLFNKSETVLDWALKRTATKRINKEKY